MAEANIPKRNNIRYDEKSIGKSEMYFSSNQPERREFSTIDRNRTTDFIVYVVELPQVRDRRVLEDSLRRTIEECSGINVILIRYEPAFNMASLHLDERKHQDQLVQKFKSLTLNFKGSQYEVFLTDKVEINSYFIIDSRSVSKKWDSKEVLQIWNKLVKEEQEKICQLPFGFSNIFKITSNSFEKLEIFKKNPYDEVEDTRIDIFAAADCHFITELDSSTRQGQIELAVRLKCSSKFYTQIDRKNGYACIISTRSTDDWSKIRKLEINGVSYDLEKYLSMFLCFTPIDASFDVNQVLEHTYFQGGCSLYEQNENSLIIEVFDSNLYEYYLDTEKIKLDGNRVLQISKYIPKKEALAVIDDHQVTGSKDLASKTDEGQLRSDVPIPVAGHERSSKIEMKQFEQVQNDYQKFRLTILSETASILKNQYYEIGKKKIYHKFGESLQTIIYKDTSKIISEGILKMDARRFQSTRIEVVLADFVDIYENLRQNNFNPLLVNIFNFKKMFDGHDISQEFMKDIFLQSDYYLSLNNKLDGDLPKKNIRLKCSHEGQITPLDSIHDMHSVDQFGAIYTSGITIFRNSEKVKFSMMEKPITDISVLAANDSLKLNINTDRIDPERFLEIWKKIKNIFAIAHVQKHDSVILFGLTEFTTAESIEIVARLFSSAINQYAGFFQCIKIVIPDNPIVDSKLNAGDIYRIFKHNLQTVVKPLSNHMNIPGSQFGPYTILSDGKSFESVFISDKKLCRFGGTCGIAYDADHRKYHEHPGLCYAFAINKICEVSTDYIHKYLFIHRLGPILDSEIPKVKDSSQKKVDDRPVRARGRENLIGDEDDDSSARSDKQSISNLRRFRTPSRQARTKLGANTPSKVCHDEYHCVRFHDVKHTQEYYHPFKTPCPNTPYECHIYGEFSREPNKAKLPSVVQEHCSNFAHVCPFGRSCTEKDQTHWNETIHISRNLCENGSKCPKQTDEEHLNSFTHPNIRDIRVICNKSTSCIYIQDPEHLMRYRHMIMFHATAILPYLGVNANIGFFENHKEMISRTINYAKRGNWQLLKSNEIPKDILRWIQIIQPVYGCGLETLEQIVNVGCIKKTVESKRRTQHEVRRYLSYDASNKEQAKQYEERGSLGFKPTTINDSTDTDDASHQGISKQVRLKPSEIDKGLFNRSKSIDQDNESLLDDGPTIVASLGPYFRNDSFDVIIVLKNEILHHLDASFTMQPKKSFMNGSIFTGSPWLESNFKKSDRMHMYKSNKLSRIVPGYEYAAALELIALTSNYLNKRSLDINIEEIIDRLSKVDSHENLEVHLPEVISQYYFDQIYVSSILFDEFEPEFIQKLKVLFNGKITTIPPPGVTRLESGLVDETKIILRKNRAIDNFRGDFHSKVKIDLNRKFLKKVKDEKYQIPQGFTMTFPGTGKDEVKPYLMPLKIKQSFEKFPFSDLTSSSMDRYFIYWQVLGGNMMLSLSDQSFETSSSSSRVAAFTCHIVTKPVSTNPITYSENTTFLRFSSPLKQSKTREVRNRVVESDRFLVGCNLKDMLTLCLEIKVLEKTIILSHAGPNSIYNHEEIILNIDDSDTDLRLLNYIHLYAIQDNVQIRNFLISEEKLSHLHPNVDQDYQWKKLLKAPSSNNRDYMSDHRRTDKDNDMHMRNRSEINRMAKHNQNDLDDSVTARIPCSDSFNCLLQNSPVDSTKHNAKYSHPCRFAELCTKREKHLTHDQRQVKTCRDDQHCQKLNEPLHRANFRHTGLPDYLTPCRYQASCKDRSYDHAIKFSHGELVYKEFNNATEEPKRDFQRQNSNNPIGVCKWGLNCNHIDNPQHCAAFTHL